MKGIIGAICGDIIGSTREREGLKSTDFELYPVNSRFTDDTIMTVAIASWILEDRKDLSEKSLIKNLKYFGNNYPSAGYGGLFLNWLEASSPDPYNSEYSFDASCQGSVPESIMAFLVSDDYESTIRNAISLGGDADTQAAIAGSIASAYWEVPQDIYKPAINILNDELRDILFKFNDISL